jgi:hypothetical protein
MTDIEDQLRHDLMIITERAQPGSIRPLRAPEPRRRSRTVRWLAPLTAMAAVVGIIAGVSLAGQSAGNRQLSTALPPGTPKYYVTLKAVIPGNVTATVRKSATGAALATVLIAHVRPGALHATGLVWITAAANDRVFAIGEPFGVAILRLAPDGRVARLTYLTKEIDRYEVGALSPDGSELALPTIPPIKTCTKSSPCSDGVTVVSLATGATRTWLARSPVVVPAFVVNWPGSGHMVYFSYGGYRLLDVAGPGGSLLANSRPIASPARLPHGWSLQSSLLAPDGKTVIWGSMQLPTNNDRVATGRILELSARTGRLLRVLYTVNVHTASTSPSSVVFCDVDSLAPTGLHLLIECINFGRLDGSHFIALRGRPAHLVGIQAAW